jgi:hypothetical protein
MGWGWDGMGMGWDGVRYNMIRQDRMIEYDTTVEDRIEKNRGE